jgi:putative flippase GtrA
MAVGPLLGARRQFLAFAVVGTAGFLVDAGIVQGLTTSGVNAIVAQLAAFAVAVCVTWLGNRSWTFGQRTRRHTVAQEWVLYVSANTLGWLVNNGVYIALVLTVPVMAHQPVGAIAAGSLAGLFFNYTASRHVVFR